MTSAQWLGLVVAGSVVAAFAFWIYLRREVPVGGRPVLGGMRAGTLLLLLLLLLDPSVPGRASGPREARTWVALDASLSMTATPEGRPTPWEGALERARALQEGGALVASFGEGARFAAEDPSFFDGRPEALSTRLAPVLERALEAGAGEVIVLSDLRLEDPVAVRSLLEQGGLQVTFEDVGDEEVNAGVAGWELPSAVAAGESVTGEVAVFGSAGVAGRTASVEVREEDRLVYTSEIELPAAGRLERVPVELPPPSASGIVRYEARVRLPGDVLEDDDVRVAYAAVDPEEGLAVAVALRPDWELRFLLPVLEQVTGLSTQGYLRVGPDRYVPVGGTASGGPVDEAEVRRRVTAAEMVVLQGLVGEDPEWLREAAAGSRRAIVLAADPGGAAAAGVSAGSPEGGEWYVSAEVPPSPLAADLAGAAWQGLPPLVGLLPASREPVGEVPLRAQLRGRGGEEPALALVSGAGGRRAVALASGFWRWGFRAGPPRDAYRRLWAGVAGWLLADATVAGGPVLRPLERVVPRGESVQWIAPGLAGGEVDLRISRGDSTVFDSIVAIPESGIARTGVLPPGRYVYRAGSAATEGGEVEGRFDVEAYTAELRHPPARDLMNVTPEPAAAAGAAGERRPLRTHPAPYLVLLGLLCGEWIGRRRRGLR